MACMTAIPLQREIYYPESDGQPMAESDLHRKEMTYLLDALEVCFHAVSDVYVAGNLLLYYTEGFPKKCVAPDVFVVKGVPKRNRGSYKLWEEGAAPVFVVEVTSESTRGSLGLTRRAAMSAARATSLRPMRSYTLAIWR